MEESATTVSQELTTGSLMMILHSPIYLWRSFRQISRCNSPAPAMMYSPVLLSTVQTTKLSEEASCFIHWTNLGKSLALAGSTARFTTGATEKTMFLMVQEEGSVVNVPFLEMYLSRPRIAMIFTAQIFETVVGLGIMEQILEIETFSNKSTFLPGS